MNLDDLTIGEARKLACMFGGNQSAQSSSCCEFTGKYVVVRTYSAGVHVGVLKSRNGQEVVLTEAKRIWQWQGANTLHEVALNGVDKASKISEETPTVILTQAIEIIPTSNKGEKCLRGQSWGK
jgi:hypothetical protein